MDAASARKLIDELPMPLGQLAARALNARAGRDRHDAVFYLGEATLKLAASLRIGRWLDAALVPGGDLARRLETVVFPSLGHWCSFFREAGQALADADDQLFTRAQQKELEKTPPAWTSLATFADACVTWDVVDAETVKRLRRRGVLGFFEALVSYRNAVLGHGAQRAPKFYEDAAGILFDALAEVLRSPGLFGGLKLAVAQVEVDGKGARAHWRELQGMIAVPLDDEAKDARPGELYFRGANGAVSVHPFVILVPDERETLRFGFLNHAVEKKDQIKSADYLDYLTSDVVEDVDAVAALSGVLTKLRGKAVDAAAVTALTQSIGAAPEAAKGTDWIGRVIAEKYRITDKLGEGGMGVVYAAEHVELPRKYALTTILPLLAKNEELIERFRREAFAAAKLHHAGIVDVLDFGRVEDGTVYMVMERLEGRSLDSVEGTLSIDKAIAVAKEALDALAVAHDAGLVHRDLKPANLFLTDGGRVKVLDFGIAKMASSNQTELTSSDAILGTPLFMAPEQILSSSDVDARADVYSIGATLFRLLTGTNVVSAETMHLVVAKVAEGNIERDPRKKRSDVPAWLAAVITRALAKEPADRFASAKEMRAAFEETKVAAKPNRWPLVALGVIALGSIGFALTRSTPTPPLEHVAMGIASTSASAPMSKHDAAPPSPFERYADAVIRIELTDEKGEKTSGTGFIADDKGTIVTPSYVISPMTFLRLENKYKVVFRNGAEVEKISIVKSDDEHSLTIIRADVAHPSSGKVPAFTPLSISVIDDITVGAGVHSYGYPGGGELTLRDGAISARKPLPKYDWFWTTLPVVLGEGGGPVFDAKGDVIGMIAAMTDGKAYVMPASAFRKLGAK